jgi:acyl carrier protein phosphodiesterase
MNYLVHLYLAEQTEASRLGALIGDFVKGPLTDEIPLDIRRGIRRHRRADRFAHHSADFIRSKRRLDNRFGICKPILVDVFYDHFMARNWGDYSAVPLETFAAAVYRLLQERDSDLPAGFRPVARRMIARDWLSSYQDEETIGIVLERIAQRLSRPNPIADGLAELRDNYDGLEDDFRRFIPEAQRFLNSDEMPQ